jgi:hypothetical protein
MTEWKIVGADHRYTPLVTLWTVWGYWPSEDAVELHAAIDEYTWDGNPEHWAELIAAAEKRFGVENVRVAKVRIPWTPIVEMFEPPQLEAELPEAVASAKNLSPEDHHA